MPKIAKDLRKYCANRDRVPVESVVRSDTRTEKEILYADFVNWAIMKRMSPDQFKYIYKRYYDEYIGGL